MELCILTAISPVDGRYRDKTMQLSEYFSEYALFKYRILVEIEYFVYMCESPDLHLSTANNPEIFEEIRKIYLNFSKEDASRIKSIEKTTNHDVKAVEYFIKEAFDRLKLEKYKEFVHFGLTSQDINNTAILLSIKNALEDIFFPCLNRLLDILKQCANDWKNIAMLAKTHGQPASPTRLGKEIQVFISRLEQQIRLLKEIPLSTKFGGATGNFNAHHVAYPGIDWKTFGDNFVKKLGLVREEYTTQISNYDNLSALFDGIKRINTILIDLSQDFWLYISMEYFKQKVEAGEVGSSAMPHKINPIDFENAEGNLGIANALLEHLSAKLPVSRLQRDLTDSTVLRNTGVIFAHTLISFQSLQKGLNKLLINEQAVKKDLDNAWVVVTEGIQTILRREGYPEPYEALKTFIRNNAEITEKSIKDFINTLNINNEIKKQLNTITPQSYTGI